MRPKLKFRQLSDAEKAIGRRVAECRKFRLWKQYQLAGEMGISRDQLASVEAGRVALTTDAALKMAEVLRVSLMWLAEGMGDMKRFLALPAHLIELASNDKYFKQAFDSALKKYFVSDWREVVQRHAAGIYTKDELRIEVPSQGFMPANPGIAPDPTYVESARDDLRELEAIDLDALSAKDRKNIINQILLCKKILGQGGINQMLGNSLSSLSNNYLTDAATSIKKTGVKAQLPSLLERLNLASKEAGKMSELAEFLSKVTRKTVPLASVSRWLSGKREPGGEITLWLLQWVEQQERQR